MNSLRIGCDRIIRWSITSGGEPYDLSGKNIRLKVSTRSTQFYVSTDDFYIDGNKIIWLFRGKDQKHLGPYTLTYIENEGMDDMLTFDRCNAFNFVACSCQESRSSSKDMEISNIDLSSEIKALAVKFRPNLIPLTYQELFSLRASSGLLPGAFYRITDYVTLTFQENTQSAGHEFDLVVLALSKDALSERAYAMLHEVESHRELTLSSESGTAASYRETGETVEVQGHTYYRWDRIGGGDSVYFNTATPAKGATPYSLQSNGGMAWEGYFFLNTEPETVYDGDTYFHEAGVNLSAWQIWYCLDNDRSRFAWAVPSYLGGKGVIYRMIDEFENDCPYDFKNIMFRNVFDSEDKGYYYTFAYKEGEQTRDFSIGNGKYCYGNIMGPVTDEVLWSGYIDSLYGVSGQKLNNIIFFCAPTSSCCSNKFGSNCAINKFGLDCYENTFGDFCFANECGVGFRGNLFGSRCTYNNFGDECTANIFEGTAGGNVFRNYCTNNYFGVHCNSNSFGYGCRYNRFGNGCHSNSFGVYCRYNKADDGVNSVELYNIQTASDNQQVQNYHLTRGVDSITIEVERNRAYETTVAKDSAGNVKQFCIADIIL